MTHRHLKSVAIANEVVFLGAIVVSEHLFVQVAEQVKRLNADIGSLQSALDQAPEVFQSVSVNLPVNVFFGVVYNLVLESLLIESHVGHERIGVDRAARLDVGANVGLQKMFLAITDDSDANLTAAFKNALNGSLVFGASMGNPELALIGVHVSGKAADESFVYFDFLTTTAELYEMLFMQDETNSMHHKPCRLLGDSQSARYFVRTDSILGIHDEPNGDHPLIHAERGILKDSAHLDGELFLAALTEPNPPCRDKRMLGRIAAWASDAAIRPSQFYGVVKRALGVGEESDCFLQRLGKLEVICHA